jgi:hypothetical protein
MQTPDKGNAACRLLSNRRDDVFDAAADGFTADCALEKRGSLFTIF